VLSVAMMSAPGVVPFLNGSSLATMGAAAVIGAFFGGMMGWFLNMARTHEEVPLHAEAMREHGVAVAAHVREEVAVPALEMLREHSGREVRSGDDAWSASGWKGASENLHPDPWDSSVTAR
jgi:hypothetical protein